MRFGRLTVLSLPDDYNKRKPKWLCLCQCGTRKLVGGDNLRRGVAKSCGCLIRDVVSQRNMIHGMGARGNKKSREYVCWANMKARCLNEAASNYKYYGGRGIAVCQRWMEFLPFFEDMGRCPKGMTIGRIDNDGHYEPGNCRWVTQQEQDRNKRSSVFVTAYGKTQTVAEWSKELQISPFALYYRIRRGDNHKEALDIVLARTINKKGV